MQNLNPNALDSLEEDEHSTQSMNNRVASISLDEVTSINQSEPPSTSAETIIVFGGYSYGSMICLNLPSSSDIISHFLNPSQGSSQAEIRLRATHLSEQKNRDCKFTQRKHGAESFDELPAEPFHSVKFGGNESEASSRHPPRHSHRGFGAVRTSFDMPRIKHGSKRHSAEDSQSLPACSNLQGATESSVSQNLRCSYLLISPLLPPISTFATMFTKLKAPQAPSGIKKPHSHEKYDPVTSTSTKRLTENPTLAIYGDQDFFTSHKKLRRWAESLKQVTGSCFEFHEIAGAGHFWHEDGAELQMKIFIRAWLESICLPRVGLEPHYSPRMQMS